MVNTREIKARMVSLGLTQPIIAERMGMNVGTLNFKLNNRRRFYIDELVELRDILKLKTAEEQKRLLGVALS